MDIIIVGAGQVGSHVAEHLVMENNNVTLIDTDESRLRALAHKLDIRIILGYGSHPTILKEAGADTADMLIAVSNNDEVNMMACQVAYSLFKIPAKIARIHALDYFVRRELFSKEDLPIDFFISPENEITFYIQSLIDLPGALQVLTFAHGQVQMVALKILSNDAWIGKNIKEICQLLPHIAFQIIAIYRGNNSISLNEQISVQLNDEVFFITDSRHIQQVMHILRKTFHSNRRIMITDGGNIGYSLAKALQTDYQVKVIEPCKTRATEIAQTLDKSIVLLGEASDKKLLINENISSTDVFCALTRDDEVNIISAIQAKRLGAHQVIALITKSNYIDLIQGEGIDIAISPQLITINGILTHLRQGDVTNVYSLRRGAAEVIEVVAHGDQTTSHVVGKKLSEIKLPPNTVIGALVRKEEILINQPEIIVQANDHVILFLSEKKYINDVERLFQVKVTF